MNRYLSRDRPESVQPPGGDGWEATAVAWLLDLAPEYRQYSVVCRHPVILAYIACHLVHGSAEGARWGYRTVRPELAEYARRMQLTPRLMPIASKAVAWLPLSGPWSWWNAPCAVNGSEFGLTPSLEGFE